MLQSKSEKHKTDRATINKTDCSKFELTTKHDWDVEEVSGKPMSPNSSASTSDAILGSREDAPSVIGLLHIYVSPRLGRETYCFSPCVCLSVCLSVCPSQIVSAL